MAEGVRKYLPKIAMKLRKFPHFFCCVWGRKGRGRGGGEGDGGEGGGCVQFLSKNKL